jgi:hypothetical protein
MDPDLMRRVKQLALRRGRTVTSLIEEGLRLVLARGEGPIERARVVLPTGAGTGLLPGVDLDDGGPPAGGGAA